MLRCSHGFSQRLLSVHFREACRPTLWHSADARGFLLLASGRQESSIVNAVMLGGATNTRDLVSRKTLVVFPMSVGTGSPPLVFAWELLGLLPAVLCSILQTYRLCLQLGDGGSTSSVRSGWRSRAFRSIRRQCVNTGAEYCLIPHQRHGLRKRSSRDSYRLAEYLESGSCTSCKTRKLTLSFYRGECFATVRAKHRK